uniref:Cyclic nucleotide-binding domain-containing protein n=1 Tax=Chromera velia CCMP2878 TaxID=1169474 RepID=A0A0G4G639_9ALVE|eukprot:Cvel_20443.t1-p1 / transcript=Cvel_20443.t1 / gene=Cvel_20443 / organism=Chromera_velia_CCMP2878 / gene_product=cAMP-dependent protein kinase regulatory subunit, putative / transcript_product=cAMP-dependent protein kinase regulatory subunit, putative / location=Cvel_scaffold1833:4763-10367(+) / protein_length=383 / sequence_SO=supercontig / SO=protein_coding / is_pseudo=false
MGNLCGVKSSDVEESMGNSQQKGQAEAEGSLPGSLNQSQGSQPAQAPAPAPAQLAVPGGAKRNRRASVSAESVNPLNYQKVVHPKDEGTKERLRKMVPECNQVLFSKLSPQKLEDIVDAMFEVKVPEGKDLIKQGEEGDNFYLVFDGEFDIFVSRDERGPQKVMTAGPGKSFGELALMYFVPRAATVTATRDSVCWALSRYAFQHLIVAGEQQQQNKYEAFISSVPVFDALNKYEKMQLAEALRPEEIAEGTMIIKQGDPGNDMYILEEGEAVALLSKDGKPPVEVMQYKTGSYFGELAIIGEQPRAASVQAKTACKLLSISRAAFTRILGPIKDILQRKADSYAKYEDAIKAQDVINERRASQQGAPKEEDDEDESPPRGRW